MSRRAFTTYVSKHMEQIALPALPRNVEPDSETKSDAGASLGHASPRFPSVADLENHPGRSSSWERGKTAAPSIEQPISSGVKSLFSKLQSPIKGQKSEDDVSSECGHDFHMAVPLWSPARKDRLPFQALLDTCMDDNILRSAVYQLGLEPHVLPPEERLNKALSGETVEVAEVVQPKWHFLGLQGRVRFVDAKFRVVEELPAEHIDMELGPLGRQGTKEEKKRRLKYIGMPRILLATTKTFEVGFSGEEG
ncbi:hypothetical protein OEA41_010298 [Lepraria neglecta]|uniref:Uncharacterized protein n=1 Tax=Lepraria neglecta TaxID=209136 RepID=A0AAE0DDN8_9LECA|nr:hypothetical protein OEA41_010298 [Lepraria neglecta]